MGVRPLHQFLVMHQHRRTEATGAAILPSPLASIALDRPDVAVQVEAPVV